MPGPARRSSRSAAVARNTALGKQSTLSFTNRVVKSGAAKAPGKDKNAEHESPIATPPPSKLETVELEEEDEEEEAEVEVVIEKTEAEVRAEKVTDAQIRKYWKGVEEARLARRVHQEDVGLGEKVLRYFDISSQYGVSYLQPKCRPFGREWAWLAERSFADLILQPCIGMPRMKRWYRAERLGLNPPTEVLAVLLKETPRNADIERSAMDRLMSSTAIGSG